MAYLLCGGDPRYGYPKWGAYMLGMLKSLMLSSLPLWQSGVDDHDVAQAFLLGLDDASISFDTNVLQKLQVRNRVETALLAQKELKKS